MTPGTLSLRALSLGSVVLFGLLVAGDAAALVWASRVVRGSGDDLVRDARSAGTTYEFDRTLRERNRLWNLWIATRDPELQTAQADLESGMRGLMGQLEGYTGDAAERRLLGQLEEQVAAYLATCEAVEARGLALERQSGPFARPSSACSRRARGSGSRTRRTAE